MFYFKIHDQLADTIPIIPKMFYLKGILNNYLHISNNSIFKKSMLNDKKKKKKWCCYDENYKCE